MFDLETVATVSGHFSIVGWVLAGVYQLYVSALDGTADSFSPFFLAGYVIGDISNVVGCFWGGQMGFQKVISLCSLLTDSLMALQYIYFRRKQSLKLRRSAALLRPVAYASMVAVSMASPLEPPSEIGGSTQQFLIGQSFAWLAETFYVGAVVQQALKNYEKKSTGAVSRLLFIFDLFGSLSTLLTIFVTSRTFGSTTESLDFLATELPYLVGATVCAAMDVVLLYQYRLYPRHLVVLDGYREDPVESTTKYGSI